MTHGHSHSHMPDKVNLAFMLAVGLNLAFTIAEALFGVLANSMSLLADAIHNLGDVVGLLFAWVANWLHARASTERYSYGFKRTTILAAIANALFLVSTSVLIAYESIQKLLHPTDVNEITVIIVALVGIAVNGGTAMLFFKGRKSDLNLKGAFLHLAADALISAGVVLGAVLLLFTGFDWIDPIVGLIIVITILYGSWELLRDSINLILDAVPNHIDQKAVREYLCKLPGVEAIHDLHIWGLSTKDVALTTHLVMPTKKLSDKDHAKINKTLRDKFSIHHVTIQVETSADDDICGQIETC